jgi:hypothetical protein
MVQGLKSQLYKAVVEQLLEHEFDINKGSKDRKFSFQILNNFDVEYSVSMSWCWGLAKKHMPVARITPRQVLDKISKLPGFRSLASFGSSDSDEIVRMIGIAYAHWQLGVKINVRHNIADAETIVSGSDNERYWQKFYECVKEPSKSIKEILIEAKESPIERIEYDIQMF